MCSKFAKARELRRLHSKTTHARSSPKKASAKIYRPRNKSVLYGLFSLSPLFAECRNSRFAGAPTCIYKGRSRRVILWSFARDVYNGENPAQLPPPLAAFFCQRAASRANWRLSARLAWVMMPRVDDDPVRGRCALTGLFPLSLSLLSFFLSLRGRRWKSHYSRTRCVVGRSSFLGLWAEMIRFDCGWCARALIFIRPRARVRLMIAYK